MTTRQKTQVSDIKHSHVVRAFIRVHRKGGNIRDVCNMLKVPHAEHGSVRVRGETGIGRIGRGRYSQDDITRSMCHTLWPLVGETYVNSKGKDKYSLLLLDSSPHEVVESEDDLQLLLDEYPTGSTFPKSDVSTDEIVHAMGDEVEIG